MLLAFHIVLTKKDFGKNVKYETLNRTPQWKKTNAPVFFELLISVERVIFLFQYGITSNSWRWHGGQMMGVVNQLLMLRTIRIASSTGTEQLQNLQQISLTSAGVGKLSRFQNSSSCNGGSPDRNPHKPTAQKKSETPWRNHPTAPPGVLCQLCFKGTVHVT